MDPVYKASEDTYLLEIETEAIENYTITARAALFRNKCFLSTGLQQY